jgi:hypothetical protein
MRLIFYTVPSPQEEKDNLGLGLRLEREVGWDANGDDYVRAFAGFMLAVGFATSNVCDSMRGYADEWDPEDPEDEDSEAV